MEGKDGNRVGGALTTDRSICSQFWEAAGSLEPNVYSAGGLPGFQYHRIFPCLLAMDAGADVPPGLRSGCVASMCLMRGSNGAL